MGDRIAEIRARVEAATPGPWERCPVSAWNHTAYFIRPAVGRALDEVARIIAGPIPQAQTDGDADLIANAPTDLAFLLDENERLNRALTEAEGRLADARDRGLVG